ATLSPSMSPNMIPEPINLEPILSYAETHNYLSCPRSLILIMMELWRIPGFNDRSHRGADCNTTQEQVGILLQRTLAFDPYAWYCGIQSTGLNECVEQRTHIACAHRSAVCIYLAQVLPATSPLINPESDTALISLTDVANDVLFHISLLIACTDSLFTSICWPLFLAGTELKHDSQREWIINKLDELYNIMAWGYIRTSKRVLEDIWRYKYYIDSKTYNSGLVEEMGRRKNEIIVA
ncbi:hypothetical protein C7974DRAFT_314670, partial [Boeremia exigua]|uniref:uncharacterized protein n=1 Tax=Boeremia exigua TaxID=749465 RepID=UPI001E8E061D